MADCILLNAGEGLRFGAPVPKQYVSLNRRPVFTYAVQTIKPLVDRLIIVTAKKYIEAVSQYVPEALVVEGGATRQESVRRGLAHVTSDQVVIHETVRPFVTADQIKRGLAVLDKYPAASFSLPLVESLATQIDGKIVDTVNREFYRTLQCPQFFRTSALRKGHGFFKEASFTDDTRLMREMGLEVKLLEGDYNLTKLTFPQDFEILESMGE